MAETIAVLSNEWKELQVWARLDHVPVNSPQEPGETPMETIQGVILTVEAANQQAVHQHGLFRVYHHG